MLEIALLVVYGYAGFMYGDSTVWQWVLGICLPLVVAAVWGLVISPKAPINTPYILQLLLEIVLFGTAVFLLYIYHHAGLAWSLAVIYIFNRSILLVLEKRMEK